MRSLRDVDVVSLFVMNFPESHLHRITVDPNMSFGKPTVRGTRYAVKFILEWLAGGMTIEEILNDYPDLEREDIYACLEYAAKLTELKIAKTNF